MSVSKEELRALIREVLADNPIGSHKHDRIDKHYAECPDCGSRNPDFHPDLACEKCERPVYKEDPKCPWCGHTKGRELTKEDVDRLFSHLHRIRG